MKQIQKFYPHLVAVIGFIIVSLFYFYPVLQGKKILQSDIVQYTAMAKEQNDFRAKENAEPYWTNSAFGGMPTYQLGAKYPNDFIGHLDDALRFLPRPADYLFLYFLGFYILLLVLKIDPLKAFFGALGFGLSTYLIVILGTVHSWRFTYNGCNGFRNQCQPLPNDVLLTVFTTFYRNILFL